MKSLANFAGQNWLIAPAALAANEPPPADIRDQKWLLVLAGVVNADFEGNSTHQWLHETLSFVPDMAVPSTMQATVTLSPSQARTARPLPSSFPWKSGRRSRR
jgi:hypothetical protein